MWSARAHHFSDLKGWETRNLFCVALSLFLFSTIENENKQTAYGPSTEERRKVQWAWRRIAAIWKQSNAPKSLACIWATQYYLNSHIAEDCKSPCPATIMCKLRQIESSYVKKTDKNFFSCPNWALNGPFKGQPIPFQRLNHHQLIHTIPRYHDMQNQQKWLHIDEDNGLSPHLGPFLALNGPFQGQQNFHQHLHIH